MDNITNEIFSEVQIDAIGEIMNISLGSSATSMSTMLNMAVDITTPTVTVLQAQDFHFENYEPAIGVEINYTVGLSGTNVMILKESDIKIIVGLLLGSDYENEDFEMDEMSISAVCEVMNQMMGASSTALSQLFGMPIDISTPQTFPITDSKEFKSKYYSSDNIIVCVKFNLKIGDLTDSEFISVLPINLAQTLVSILMDEDDEPEVVAPVKEEPVKVDEVVQQPVAAPTPKAPMQQPPVYESTPQPQQPQQPQYQPPQYQQPPQQMTPPPQYAYPQQPSNYNVRQAQFEDYSDFSSLTVEQNSNLDLIMTVPLEISVEIGRSKRKVKDILDFTTGSVIDLNHQAGSAVDVFVNGKPVAKGDVVVIDDYYGVRITEILSNAEILKNL